MAATYITGRSLTLTVGAKAYNDQASTVTLTLESNQAVLEVLSGRAYKTIDASGTLDVEMYADWGAAQSICQALWDATKTAPDTTLSASFVANGSTFACDVYPAYPAVGGGAVDVLTTTVSLVIKAGSVTKTP
jgi:hypothetical protein